MRVQGDKGYDALQHAALQKFVFMVFVLGVGLTLLREFLGLVTPLGRLVTTLTTFLSLGLLLLERPLQRRLFPLLPWFYGGLLLLVWLNGLYWSWPAAAAQVAVFSVVTVLPLLYVLCLLVLPPPRAQIGAFGFLGVLVLTSLPHALANGVEGGFGGIFLPLLLLAGHSMLIGLLFTFVKLNVRLHEVSEEAKHFEHLALHDTLTGIANRRQTRGLLEGAVAEAEEHGGSFALMLIDIDHFKRFNDSFGHDVGDAVLHEVAQRMQTFLRLGDLLGRWGGEEFVVLVQPGTLSEARGLAQRLCERVQAASFAGHKLTVSCGVSAYRPGDTSATLLKRADEALYRAKEGGRNRVEVG